MKRILTAVVVIPLFLIVSLTPAHAVFGSILAGIQRALMIGNQITQISNDIIAKITFDGQLTQMIGQAQHLKEQALGTVGRADRSVHRTGFYPDQVYRPWLVVEERLYRHPSRHRVERREDGRGRQELSGIVGATARRRRYGIGVGHS